MSHQNYQLQYLAHKHGKNLNELFEYHGDHIEWIGDGHDLYEAFCYQQKMLSRQKVFQYCVPARRTRTTPRRIRQRGKEIRSSVASGDSNSDPDRHRQLYDQAALANLLCISKKTLQNQYSVAPHTLPPAISIPGARGPRWTLQAIQDWLDARPQHTPKPVPVAPPSRKVGRPRIAFAGKGGVS